MLVPWLPWTWFRAGRECRRAAPEVVVIQWWHPLVALSSWHVARRSRAAGARVIFVCHNASPHEAFPLARPLSRMALQTGTTLIAMSDAVATELRELVPRQSVQVIPHPSYQILAPEAKTLERQRQDWQRRIGAPGAKVVLFFGNVRPYKGLRDLLDAFQRVMLHATAVLVVAGTFFESADDYRTRIKELGLEEVVRLFPAYVANEDVAGLFAASDLVVLPYRSASQSGVIPLAAMFEKPVVATAVGGIATELAGRGILVPPCDPVSLGDAILSALTQPPRPPVTEPNVWERWRDAVLSE